MSEQSIEYVECYSCSRPPTYISPNGRVRLCDLHRGSLPRMVHYVRTPPESGSTP